MNVPANQPANAGGFIIAAALIVGTIIGLIFGQPTIGFLAGLGLGALVSLLMWMKDRR